jgi:hypothetical protein
VVGGGGGCEGGKVLGRFSGMLLVLAVGTEGSARRKTEGVKKAQGMRLVVVC